MAGTSYLHILRQHVYQTFARRRGQWQLLAQLAVYAALIGGMWPRNQTLNTPAQPAVLLWLAYLHTYFLGRLVLSVTAQATSAGDVILPQEWLRFGPSSPLGVVLSHTLSAPIIVISWTALTTPMWVTATLLHTGAVYWSALAAYWFILGWVLAFWGTWIAISVQRRRHRASVCHGAWTGFMLAALLLLYADEAGEALLGTSLPAVVQYNPLSLVRALITGAPISGWRSIYVVQLGLMAAAAAAGLVLAVVRIWRWRERQVSDVG